MPPLDKSRSASLELSFISAGSSSWATQNLQANLACPSSICPPLGLLFSKQSILGSHSHCIPAPDVDRGALAVGALLSPSMSLACMQLELSHAWVWPDQCRGTWGHLLLIPHGLQGPAVSPLPPMGLLFLLPFCLLTPLQPQDFALYCFNPSTSNKVWR